MPALTAERETVITPFTGPVSLPLVVLAIVTNGESLSKIVLVAESVVPKVARPDVMLLNVMMTVSLPSTAASLMIGILIVAVVKD